MITGLEPQEAIESLWERLGANGEYRARASGITVKAL